MENELQGWIKKGLYQDNPLQLITRFPKVDNGGNDHDCRMRDSVLGGRIVTGACNRLVGAWYQGAEGLSYSHGWGRRMLQSS